MSAMIERVALAMWRKREETFPGFTRRMAPDDIDRASGAWAAMFGQAHAAVAAMEEPTEAMFDALSATDKMWREMNSREVWTTMARGALK